MAIQAQFRYPDANGTISVECYTGAGGAVAIPTIINGLPVTSIGDRAFQDCTNLTNVTIPNSVTSIGQGAFQGCTSLASVSIGNSVTSIGQDAFGGCYSLTNVTIPNSVTSIRDSAFCICPSLTRVTIPDSVTSIGQDAFNGCTSLTGVSIGNSVTSIGDGAFEGTSLTNITIPDSVTSVGQDAFGGCVKLTGGYFKGTVRSPGDADELDGEYIDPGFAVQAEPLCEPAPPPTVQSTAAIQRGRIIPVRDSRVLMALAGGLGVSALLGLSVAHNQNTSRAKRRKLAGLKIGLQMPRQICIPAKVRNGIKNKLAGPPVSHQRKSRLRMERAKCCRLCGEPAVSGALCLRHGIAHRERARKRPSSKHRNNKNTLRNKLDAKAKAPVRRKRTKKSK